MSPPDRDITDRARPLPEEGDGRDPRARPGDDAPSRNPPSDQPSDPPSDQPRTGPARHGPASVAQGDSDEVRPSNAGHAQPRDQEWIGPLKVLGQLGIGAMGVVLLAEQQSPRRKVALKVLRPEVMNPIREKRFEIETESLAMLKHPGIAPIFASGRADIGGRSHPYFAMELVRGRSLDVYARTVDRRLRLGKMISICEAVDHAHRHGVVHRDLKPANILVDDAGRARILDFGVAKLVGSDPDMPDLVGTMGYMSPEQLRGERAVDGRTDVYSLGVILHEITTGQRPYALEGLTIDDALRVIHNSPRRSAGGANGLGRELNAIIERAMAPDPDDRYESALALGADIRRLLNTRPVRAVGDARGYRARKFISRNRGPVALTLIAVLAIGVGVAGVSWQAARATRGWHQARQEQQRAQEALATAESQRRRAVAINMFMIDMLTSADPESSLGSDLTVREVLDASALTIDREFSDQPDINSGVRMALANTYLSLGEVGAAEIHARRMLAVCQRAFGDDDVQTADAKRTLALVLMEQGELERAGELLDEARIVVDRQGDPVDSAKLLSELGRIAHGQGHHEQALGLWERSEDILRRELGPDSRDALIVMNNRGMTLKDLGRFQESESLMREVYDARVRVFGADHPQTLVALNILAGVIQKQGRDTEAAGMLRRVVETRRRVLGDEHFSTQLAMGNLAVALIRMGQLDEAERLTRTALAGYEQRFGPTHTRTLVLKGNLAYLLEDRGKFDEAAALYRETIDARRDAQGGLDPETWAPMNNLAMLLMTNARASEARPLFEELLAMCESMLPPDHYYTALFRNNYAQCLTDLGDYEGAQTALEQSHPVLVQVFGEGHERVLKSQARIDRLRALMGTAPGDQAPGS